MIHQLRAGTFGGMEDAKTAWWEKALAFVLVLIAVGIVLMARDHWLIRWAVSEYDDFRSTPTAFDRQVAAERELQDLRARVDRLEAGRK